MANSDNLPPESDEFKEGGIEPLDKSQKEDGSASKEQEDGGRIVPSADSDSTPMVPLDRTNPNRAIVSILENPSVLDALVHEAPAEVIKFVESADERQFKYYSQKEANRHEESMAREATTRIAIGAVGGAVLVAFGYSAFTGDTSLSAQIIAVIVGGFGGLGIGEIFKKKEEE